MTPVESTTGEQLYLRFLKLAQSLRISANGKDLTPPEMHLLEDVALRHFENRAYTVSEALALQHMGSPATLHKRLKRLRTWGLLRFEQAPTDHRTKYLLATPLAIAHFERLSDAMHLVMQGSKRNVCVELGEKQRYEPACINAMFRCTQLSLPIDVDNTPLKGPTADNFFENLLPDEDTIRR